MSETKFWVGVGLLLSAMVAIFIATNDDRARSVVMAPPGVPIAGVQVIDLRKFVIDAEAARVTSAEAVEKFRKRWDCHKVCFMAKVAVPQFDSDQPGMSVLPPEDDRVMRDLTYCKLAPDELKGIKIKPWKGDIVEVTGTIQDINVIGAILTDCRVRVLSPAQTPCPCPEGKKARDLERDSLNAAHEWQQSVLDRIEKLTGRPFEEADGE